MLGKFVNRKVAPGLVQKLAWVVVLKWVALMKMTSKCLITRACALQSSSMDFVLGVSAQKERSHSHCSGCWTMMPNLPTPWRKKQFQRGQREFQRQRISGMPKQIECFQFTVGAEVSTAEKVCCFGRNGLAQFRDLYALRTVSYLISTTSAGEK
jgi:hypothetical protein